MPTNRNASSNMRLSQHQSIAEINLAAMRHNLNAYRALLQPSTKIMAMVKAGAYGIGSPETPQFLEQEQIDYLGVAFIDEGIQIRNARVKTPIMVMKPHEQEFSSLIQYDLEPEIHSFEQFQKLNQFVKSRGIQNMKIHLKLDTGMHRLGLSQADLKKLLPDIPNSNLTICSVLSHLAAAGDPDHDHFTLEQLTLFEKLANEITEPLAHKPFLHILNSSGIERFPQHQHDLVRLGIGLYGLSENPAMNLAPVVKLKSAISQIKTIQPHETIGYNRTGRVNQTSEIATVPLGYADGLNRLLGNGHWKVEINGKLAPTIGDVCMDMFMINVTGLQAKTGDEVILIGDKNSAIDMAKKLQTIPYEIITSLSLRLRRVFIEPGD